MIIFKNLKNAPKGSFPYGMAVTGTPGGMITQELMIGVFSAKILNRRPDSFFIDPKTLLIMDTALGHLGMEVKEKYKAKNIDIMSIGGGLTSLLQFIDTYTNKSLKDRMRGFLET